MLYYYLSKLTEKYIVKDNKTLYYFVPLIAAFIPTLVVLIIRNSWRLHLDTIADLEYWGLILLAIVISSTLTIVFSPSTNKVEPMELSMRCLHGGFMEVPERVMLQNFTLLMLMSFNIQAKYSVLISSIVIALGIIIDAILRKDKDYRSITVKVISSLIFSLLVGHVYYFSGCIIYCIVGHILERFISNIFYIRKKIVSDSEYDYQE